MPRPPLRHYFTIRRDVLESMQPRALLGMLRYDGAKIEGNAPNGEYLLSSDHPPTIGRWRSFGVQVTDTWQARHALDMPLYTGD